MDVFHADKENGVQRITRLKSRGGHKADGLHYFAAHKYVVPGLFAVRFGMLPYVKGRFSTVGHVTYKTLVRDSGTKQCLL